MTRKPILGVDLGGTKIMSGIVTPKGEILGKPCTIPTGGKDPEKVIINRVFNSIEKALSNARLGDFAGIIGAACLVLQKKI